MRKERDRTGQFFVEGVRFVRAALETGAEIVTLITAPEQFDAARVRALPLGKICRGSAHLQVSPTVLRWLADREDTQGVGAVLCSRWERLERASPAAGMGWVALDGIQYPGNLGTILRACDAVGCGGVILIGNTADPFDPIAVRASMGALFYVPVVRCSFEEFVAWTRRNDVAVIGASPEAPVGYRQVGFRSPTVLFMGSESKGLSPERQQICENVVRIPMVGRCDSLNVAMAAAVLLYEVYHQTMG